ncbi:MAG: DUF5050 domain-containing protein [Clostridiales bacterium]|nr:DUF5050 domain-containing protein [Clostridiales bacterium]
MKKSIAFLLVLLFLFSCACETPTAIPAPATDAPITATPEITAIPTPEPTPTPTVKPDPTPLPQKPSFENWDIDDNGIDGVGVWRGNTNSDLVVSGLAVDAWDTVYYVSKAYQQSRLIAHDKASGAERVLYEVDNWDNINSLNWYDGLLWFYCSYYYDGGWLYSEVHTLDPATGELKTVYRHNGFLVDLMVVYDLVLIGRVDNKDLMRIDTVCLNIETLKEIRVPNHFWLTNAMDGWLYGYHAPESSEDKTYYKMRPDGKEKSECPPVLIAAHGKLYHSDYGMNITDAEAGKTQRLYWGETGAFRQYFYVSRHLIYLNQVDWEDNPGVYAADLDGTNLTRMPDETLTEYGFERKTYWQWNIFVMGDTIWLLVDDKGWQKLVPTEGLIDGAV